MASYHLVSVVAEYPSRGARNGHRVPREQKGGWCGQQSVMREEPCGEGGQKSAGGGSCRVLALKSHGDVGPQSL